MCFIIHGSCPLPRVAFLGDIDVYKRGFRKLELSYPHTDRFISPIQNKVYTQNKVYRLFPRQMRIVDGYDWHRDELRKEITRDFHSFANLVKAKSDIPDDVCIAHFVIPKGAKYFYNPDNLEYVSNKIIFKGFV